MKFVCNDMLGIGILVLVLSAAHGASFRTSDCWVDLTHPFDKTTLGYPGIQDFNLFVIHNGTTDEGYWLQLENYSSGIHTGTHMDAPCHIKKGQWCLDEIPIDRFMGYASVVDIRHRTNTNPDANLEVEDLINWERDNQRQLQDIVFVNSGWGPKWSNPEAFLGTTTQDTSKVHFPGISPEAARWIRDFRKIYGIGVDTTSLDNGQAKKRDAHEALFEADIYGMENVANLDQLPPSGAYCYVFPMKITNASGAPVRIICKVPGVLYNF